MKHVSIQQWLSTSEGGDKPEVFSDVNVYPRQPTGQRNLKSLKYHKSS